MMSAASALTSVCGGVEDANSLDDGAPDMISLRWGSVAIAESG
jgi:hypothetical protein